MSLPEVRQERTTSNTGCDLPLPASACPAACRRRRRLSHLAHGCQRGTAIPLLLLIVLLLVSGCGRAGLVVTPDTIAVYRVVMPAEQRSDAPRIAAGSTLTMEQLEDLRDRPHHQVELLAEAAIVDGTFASDHTVAIRYPVPGPDGQPVMTLAERRSGCSFSGKIGRDRDHDTVMFQLYDGRMLRPSLPSGAPPELDSMSLHTSVHITAGTPIIIGGHEAQSPIPGDASRQTQFFVLVLGPAR